MTAACAPKLELTMCSPGRFSSAQAMRFSACMNLTPVSYFRYNAGADKKVAESLCVVALARITREQRCQGVDNLGFACVVEVGIADAIARESARCGMPYVSERWLGGALTNFRTIRSRLGRLEELETLRSSEDLSNYSKKMQSALNREYRKMYRNLNGMRTMNRLPECVVVFDPNKERNAIREARKLGITTVALIDSDCDPDDVDLPIPGDLSDVAVVLVPTPAVGARSLGHFVDGLLGWTGKEGG